MITRGRSISNHLSERLAVYGDDCLKIGAFSAASNVTGVRSNLAALARLLHMHDARFICDFAAGAPYMDMSLELDPADKDCCIDAIVYSSHKFVGGPGASGVLIADKALFTSDKPGVTGGGTVAYVTEDHHTYVKALERREEAGTPCILADIRAGAVMALKEAVGAKEIERREEEILASVSTRLSAHPNVEILGPNEGERLTVFSFNLRIQEAVAALWVCGGAAQRPCSAYKRGVVAPVLVLMPIICSISAQRTPGPTRMRS